MDRRCDQQGSLKENRNYKETEMYNQRQLKLSGSHNEERSLENLTLTKHIEEAGETTSNLLNDFM